MKIIIQIDGINTEIVLTAEQLAKIEANNLSGNWYKREADFVDVEVK